MSRAVSVRTRMRRLALTSSALIVAGFALILALLMARNKQYAGLLYNVATASEFNQDFKNNIDQKMYYYVIESQYSEGLPIGEVEAAQDLARSLLATTSQKDSLLAITSVLNLCQNLEEKIYQIQDTPNYDSRQNQLENNIYVLTSLIQEYMYNYLYYESVQLNVLQRQIDRQIAAEILLVAVLSAALIAALCWYSVRVSRSVAVPIVELCQRAEDVAGGDLTVKEPVRSHTYEIRTLSESMEQMIVRLNAQIEQTTQKQASLRRAELALLQAQINPHFLYNTLDTIIWLIEAGKTLEAEEMVSNLSSFFRHSLSRGEDVITLKEEEGHVRSYLQIQQARYKDVMRYSIDIDPGLREEEQHVCSYLQIQQARYKDIMRYTVNIAPEAEEVLLPKLTLQPLVENALYHGVKLKRALGCISVTGRAEGGDILLRVADDGVGMTPERLEQLRSSRDSGERVGFGLATVDERLRLLFGPDYGLSIASREGEGTTVTVRIPRRTEKEAAV